MVKRREKKAEKTKVCWGESEEYGVGGTSIRN